MCSIIGVQLVDQILKMKIDRGFGDLERVGDLFVPVAIGRISRRTSSSLAVEGLIAHMLCKAHRDVWWECVCGPACTERMMASNSSMAENRPAGSSTYAMLVRFPSAYANVFRFDPSRLTSKLLPNDPEGIRLIRFMMRP